MTDGVPKEGARIEDILVRIAHIQLIEEKVCNNVDAIYLTVLFNNHA